MDANVRHWILDKGITLSTIFNRSVDFLVEEGKRARFIKSAWKSKDVYREVVKPKATATLSKIKSSTLMNLARTKIGKGGLVVAAGLVGWNLIQHTLKSIGNPQPAIPRNFDRGYDILNEHMTDFGSPVKLAKAANKIITPYKSSVRKGIYTNTKAIRERNLALQMSNNAIRHHHY